MDDNDVKFWTDLFGGWVSDLSTAVHEGRWHSTYNAVLTGLLASTWYRPSPCDIESQLERAAALARMLADKQHGPLGGKP